MNEWREIPNIDYHKTPGISSSGLSHLVDSPAHYKAYIDKEFVETDALIEGQAAHTYILEGPEIFLQRFMVAEGTRSKTQKLAAENQNKKLLTQNQANNIVEWTKAVERNPWANKLIAMDGPAELSGFWQENGVLCKIRPDKRIPKLRMIIDLKFISTARQSEIDLTLNFSKHIANYKYHIQAAFYLRGTIAIEKVEYNQFVWIVCEKEPPYQVGCYLATPEMLEEGNKIVDKLLPVYAECLEKDEWPAPEYEGIIPIYLPHWHKPIIE